jgi:hypothetical protein
VAASEPPAKILSEAKELGIPARHGAEESAFVFRREEKQILRSSTPATAKAAVAGDPAALRMTLTRFF